MKIYYQTIILFLVCYISHQLTAPISISPNQRYVNTGVCTVDTSKSYNNATASNWNPLNFTIPYAASFGTINSFITFLSLKDLHADFNNGAIIFLAMILGDFSRLVLSVYGELTNSISALSYRYLFIVNYYYSYGNIDYCSYNLSISANITASNPITKFDSSANALNMTGGVEFIASFTGFAVLTTTPANILDLSISGSYNLTLITMTLKTKSIVPLYVGYVMIYILLYNKGYFNRATYAAFYSQSHTLQSPSYTFTNASYLYQATTFVALNSVSIQGDSFIDLTSQFNSPDNFTLATTNKNSTFMFTSLNLLTYSCSYTTPFYSATDSVCYDACPIRSYSSISAMGCPRCLYDCYTCNINISCLTCNTDDHRVFNSSSSRCVPLPGYYQANITVAEPCAAGCVSCSSANVCINCTQGYYLNASTCVSCPANCASCLSANSCSNCSQGYFMNSNNCQGCSPNCFYCLTSSQCKNCSQGYYLTSNKSCDSCPANCASCLTSTQCKYCNKGYYLNKNLGCDSCPTNCDYCLSTTSCQYCTIGYFLTNTSTCQSCTTNCSFCFSSDACQYCNRGFYLLANLCQSCQSGCAYCISVSFCVSCSQGYYLSNGSCLGCSAGCTSCTSGQVCSSSTSFVLRNIWISLAVVAAIAILLFIIGLKVIHCCLKARKIEEEAPPSTRELNTKQPDDLGYKEANQSNLGSTSINLAPLPKPLARARTKPSFPEPMTEVLVAQVVLQQDGEWCACKKQENVGHQQCVVCNQQNTFLQLACGHFFHIKCFGEWVGKSDFCGVCGQKFAHQEHKVYCHGCKIKEKAMPFNEILKLYQQNRVEGDIICQDCSSKSA